MSRIVLLLCMAALLPSCESSAKRLSKQDLAALLGPGGHTTLRWSRTDGPDFAVYYGQPAAPGAGGVGFYAGMAPSFQPEAGSTTHRGRLGTFDVVWHRIRRPDGSLYQTTLVGIPDQLSFHVWVYGPHESDLETLVRELSALPQFRQGPSGLHR